MAVQPERDRRTMNHMDEETKITHARLEELYKELRDTKRQGDFPAVTILGRVIEQGIVGAGQSGPSTVQLSQRTQETQDAVDKLWQKARKCVEEYYSKPGTTETHAAAMHMSVRQFQEVLNRARWLIGSWLGDIK